GDRSMPSIRSLPARLRNARDHALVGKIAEFDAAEAELAIVAARAAGGGATVANPGRVGVARNLGELEARDQALGLVERLVVGLRLEARILAGILLHELLATLVLVDGTQFRHGLKL